MVVGLLFGRIFEKGTALLAYSFHMIFALDIHKSTLVHDRMLMGWDKSSLRRVPWVALSSRSGRLFGFDAWFTA